MTAVKERGEVDFKEAGEGYILRFSNRDLKELQEEMPGGRKWMQQFVSDLMNGANDIVALEQIARKGIKGKDGKRPDNIPEDAFDDIIVVEFGRKVLDGLFISVHGQNFKEYMDDMATKAEEAAEEGRDPPASGLTTTTSPTLEESPTGPASE